MWGWTAESRHDPHETWVPGGEGVNRTASLGAAFASIGAQNTNTKYQQCSQPLTVNVGLQYFARWFMDIRLPVPRRLRMKASSRRASA
jgi:hypothetical protein